MNRLYSIIMLSSVPSEVGDMDDKEKEEKEETENKKKAPEEKLDNLLKGEVREMRLPSKKHEDDD